MPAGGPRAPGLLAGCLSLAACAGGGARWPSPAEVASSKWLLSAPRFSLQINLIGASDEKVLCANDRKGPRAGLPLIRSDRLSRRPPLLAAQRDQGCPATGRRGRGGGRPASPGLAAAGWHAPATSRGGAASPLARLGPGPPPPLASRLFLSPCPSSQRASGGPTVPSWRSPLDTLAYLLPC